MREVVSRTVSGGKWGDRGTNRGAAHSWHFLWALGSFPFGPLGGLPLPLSGRCWTPLDGRACLGVYIELLSNDVWSARLSLRVQLKGLDHRAVADFDISPLAATRLARVHSLREDAHPICFIYIRHLVHIHTPPIAPYKVASDSVRSPYTPNPILHTSITRPTHSIAPRPSHSHHARPNAPDPSPAG